MIPLLRLIFLLNIISLYMNSFAQDDYEKEIKDWQNLRLAGLTREDGWVTLAGLYPLKPGLSRMGSEDQVEIQFPVLAPLQMGTLWVTSDSVWFTADESLNVTVDSQLVHKILLSPVEKAPVCVSGRWQWQVIRRGEQFLLRLRDTEHPARVQLTSIPYFPVDRTWCLEATMQRFDTPRIMKVPNVLGMLIDLECPGYLHFFHAGVEYKLLAISEGEDELFIIFYDETSGETTYGGGRYIYVKRPVGEEKIVLDFNRCYSPPCAFTPYATCLLPPPENRLPFQIIAGEKDPQFLHH